MDIGTRLKKAHIRLMKHPETALYSGVMMMGKSEVTDREVTAYTNGVDKIYGKKFVKGLTDEELRGLIMHENLHVALRHLIHNKDLFVKNKKIANCAADYVVNSIIHNFKDKALCNLPKGALLDEKYKDMSMREVYRLLEDKCKPKEPPKDEGDDEGDDTGGDGPTGKSEDGKDKEPGDNSSSLPEPLDEHDSDSAPESAEELKKVSDAVDNALREGGILAGRLGAQIPRAIEESLEPRVDWRTEFMEFVTSTMRGSDEYTWKRYNRRTIDYALMPTTENEKISELIVGIDTSGSIGGAELALFAGELASICTLVQPDVVRVLWWDTMVHGEQIFTDNYENLAAMLKPKGGGGTNVSSVSKYIVEKKYSPDCVVVFTDGYVEPSIQWDVTAPTMWMVTQNKSRPFPGKVVKFD